MRSDFSFRQVLLLMTRMYSTYDHHLLIPEYRSTASGLKKNLKASKPSNQSKG